MSRHFDNQDTFIVATCPTCGEVRVAPEDFELRVYAFDIERGFYDFLCTGTCDQVVRKDADAQVVRLLRSVGIKPVFADFPDEALEPKLGPKFCHDDVLDFINQLNDPLETEAFMAASTDMVRHEALQRHPSARNDFEVGFTPDE